MKIAKWLLALLVIIIATYSMIADVTYTFALMFFLLALLMLVISVEEFSKKKKITGFLLLLVSIFLCIVFTVL